VHRGVRKTPERLCFVGQKVRGDQGIFAGPDDLTTEGTLSPASIDPFNT
jgi:hypothetical protein